MQDIESLLAFQSRLIKDYQRKLQEKESIITKMAQDNEDLKKYLSIAMQELGSRIVITRDRMQEAKMNFGLAENPAGDLLVWYKSHK